MSETIISDANRVKQFDANVHKEYVRSNRFKRYMGSSVNSIIMVKEELTGKKGESINITLVGALPMTGGPNDGSTQLVGNEKALPNDGHTIKTRLVRDATVVNCVEEQASPIDIRKQGKVALKDLQMRYLRDDVIEAFNTKQGVRYGVATEAQKDSWVTANADRVLFGAANGNLVSGDHSASLANIDGTADKLNGPIIEMAKRKAQTATTANGDGIRPYKYGEDQESYVMFVNSYAFRDFRNWLESTGNLKDAMERGKANPLFSGPETYEWDGVIVRKIPEISNISGVGTAGIDVAPGFLCGTQALAAVWSKRTKTVIKNETDYGYQYGVGFMEQREVDKVLYGQGATSVDWGMVTVYTSAVPDA